MNVRSAQADGHGQAVLGTMLGGALIGIGSASLAKDISTCNPKNIPPCLKIPLDILEIAGGAMAMAQNSKSAAETAPRGGSPYSGGLNNGLPNITLPLASLFQIPTNLLFLEMTLVVIQTFNFLPKKIFNV